jgi:hypothetical protein
LNGAERPDVRTLIDSSAGRGCGNTHSGEDLAVVRRLNIAGWSRTTKKEHYWQVAISFILHKLGQSSEIRL